MRKFLLFAVLGMFLLAIASGCSQKGQVNVKPVPTQQIPPPQEAKSPNQQLLDEVSDTGEIDSAIQDMDSVN